MDDASLQAASSSDACQTQKSDNVMKYVVIALVPACCVGVYVNGWYALVVLLATMAAAVLSEYFFEKGTHRPLTLKDGSALVTGLLLGMTMPPQIPLWMPILAAVFAVLVVKQIFGGYGKNILNPALTGRLLLMLLFAGAMTDFVTAGGAHIVDTVSGATPLAAVKAGESMDLMAMLVGTTRGAIGETSALALLIGGLFLVRKKIIDFRIPVIYLAVLTVFLLIFSGRGFDLFYIGQELCGGGLMLGAWFMATDPVTGPESKTGRCLFAICLGVLTGIFRLASPCAEGVCYAILICNLLLVIVKKLVLPRRAQSK